MPPLGKEETEQVMVRSFLTRRRKCGLCMNGYATGRQNGWMSANDIRELENLDRIPAEDGGDLYLINGNMTKLADAGIFAAAAPAKGGTG